MKTLALLLLLSTSAAAGEFVITTADDATLARLAAEQQRTQQQVLQQVVDDYLNVARQNGYNLMLQALREACRTGQWANPLVCERLTRRRR